MSISVWSEPVTAWSYSELTSLPIIPRRQPTLGGRPGIWLGVNFWSRTGGPQMWRDYDRSPRI
jgi:hypothetical protein